MVLNVEVEVVSGNSVRLSWDIIDLAEITGYTVHYSLAEEENETIEYLLKVSNVTNAVLIGCLVMEVEYQFQVVAMAEVDGDMLIGLPANISALIHHVVSGKQC